MNNVYVARQPIFKKNMKLYGYELLYRKSQNNFYEGTDDDQATASLIDDFFFIDLKDLTDNKYGFINFSRNLILDEVPMLLPKESVVIEILERVEMDDEVISMCKKLKEAGYTIAMDDFIFSNGNLHYNELIQIADIIKVEFSGANMAEQVSLINKHRNEVIFLAEKVETREQYQIAQNLGYTLFQGYFFSKPLMHTAKRIGSVPSNLVSILSELNNQEPDIEKIASMFETDLELSYKLLKLVNSVYYGIRYSIESIHHAIVQIGPQELTKWINIMVLKDLQNTENKELISISLTRGKMLSLLSKKLNKKENEADYFLVGLFSSIDVLLNQKMEKVLSDLPLKDEVKTALTHKNGDLGEALNVIHNFEALNCELIEPYLNGVSVRRETFMQLYIDALKWTKQISSF